MLLGAAKEGPARPSSEAIKVLIPTKWPRKSTIAPPLLPAS
jgi:hypothetical protein